PEACALLSQAEQYGRIVGGHGIVESAETQVAPRLPLQHLSIRVTQVNETDVRPDDFVAKLLQAGHDLFMNAVLPTELVVGAKQARMGDDGRDPRLGWRFA